MTAWNENDDLFKKLLLQGRHWEVKVARRIRSWGLDVDQGALSIRDDISEAHKYAEQVDLVSYGYVLEVKSRNVAFTCPEDFPFKEIFIDTVRGVTNKHVDIFVCISQDTKEIIALPTKSTRKHWSVTMAHDNVRNIVEKFYVCDRSHWQDEDWLRWALERASTRPRRPQPSEAQA